MSEEAIWLVEGDGIDYAFGELTHRQLMDLFAVEADSEDRPPDDMAIFLMRDYLADGKTPTAIAVITQALNNALAEGEPEWTADRVRGEISLLEFEMLKSLVLDLSDFKRDYGMNADFRGGGKMQVRLENVEYSGAKFTFGALTLHQTREFFGEGRKAVAAAVIVASLNNAREMQPEAERGAEWTLDRVQEELDPIAFEMLKKDVLAFCGIELKVETPGEGAEAEPTSSSAASA